MPGLIALSVLAGIVVLLVLRATSNQAAAGEAKRRVQAHLLELVLFGDDPREVGRTFWKLTRANARVFRLLLPPVVLTIPPLLALFAVLEGYYGHAPLPVGRATILTVHGPFERAPALQPPPGLVVESPPVCIPVEHEVSWRVRAAAPLSGRVRFVLPGRSIEKSIVAGSGRVWVSSRRVRSIFEWLFSPQEARLPDGPIEWIEVRYPSDRIGWLGVEFSWPVWFLLISLLTVLLLRRRLGVEL